MHSFLSVLLAAGEAPASNAGSPLATFVPFIFMAVIFYFLLVRPQQKRAKGTGRARVLGQERR